MSIHTEDLRNVACMSGFNVCDLAADDIEALEKENALLLAERDRLRAANAELVAACDASNQCISDFLEVYKNDAPMVIFDMAVKDLRDDARKLVRAAIANNNESQL